MSNQNQLIFIPGNVPSLKNSKIKGRFPSATVQKWLRTFGIIRFDSRKNQHQVHFFKRIAKQYDFYDCAKSLKDYTDYPLEIGFHFVRNSKREWDFGNACQILLDMFTAFDLIPDDCVNYVLPFPLKVDEKYWSYNKECPGVYIQVLNKVN